MSYKADKYFQNRIKKLNKECGFTPPKIIKSKSGKYKTSSGSGFALFGIGESRKKSIYFVRRKNSVEIIDLVSPTLNDAQLDDFITGMFEGIKYYKNRARKK